MPKSVLITGCSNGGIGQALVRSFAKHGLTVFATARSTSNITGLGRFSNIHLLTLDVTDATSIAAAVKEVEAISGKLDYLVNNAGRGYFMPVMDVDIEESKKVFEVNFWGKS
jgi:1-acylglycerone phosphate reductase